TNYPSLEVTEPGIAKALFQGRKPAAKRIERDHDGGPDQIDNRQGESPSGWRSDGKLIDAWRLEHPVHLPVTRVIGDDREQMNERQVQQVVKHRHLAEDQCGAQE